MNDAETTPEEETPIATLMARHPLKLSNTDIERIIDEYRKSRKRFMLEDNKTIGKPAGKKSKRQVEAEKVKEVTDQLNLDDLLGDL